MDYIKMLREDYNLLVLLCNVCDVEVLPELRPPEDQFGHLHYSIPGKTFAEAGSGSEYLLLEDGTVGVWGSEGEGGRIADNLKEFFEFVIRCPYWMDYLREEEYQDRERLAQFAKKNFENLCKSMKNISPEFDLPSAQRELLTRLGLDAETDVVDILMRFYHCTKREPRFISTYTEDDSSTFSSTGSLFDR